MSMASLEDGWVMLDDTRDSGAVLPWSLADCGTGLSLLLGTRSVLRKDGCSWAASMEHFEGGWKGLEDDFSSLDVWASLGGVWASPAGGCTV